MITFPCDLDGTRGPVTPVIQDPEAHHPRHPEARRPRHLGHAYRTVLRLLHLDPQDSLCKQLQRRPSTLPRTGEHVAIFGWGLGRGWPAEH